MDIFSAYIYIYIVMRANGALFRPQLLKTIPFGVQKGEFWVQSDYIEYLKYVKEPYFYLKKNSSFM